MSVGDEIVTIGDTPVCTSTYQEICDLMHNLPITLTLEIKKPVSGELQPAYCIYCFLELTNEKSILSLLTGFFPCMSAHFNVPKEGCSPQNENSHHLPTLILSQNPYDFLSSVEHTRRNFADSLISSFRHFKLKKREIHHKIIIKLVEYDLSHKRNNF